jgi:hypothetical protein
MHKGGAEEKERNKKKGNWKRAKAKKRARVQEISSCDVALACRLYSPPGVTRFQNPRM